MFLAPYLQVTNIAWYGIRYKYYYIIHAREGFTLSSISCNFNIV